MHVFQMGWFVGDYFPGYQCFLFFKFPSSSLIRIGGFLNWRFSMWCMICGILKFLCILVA